MQMGFVHPPRIIEIAESQGMKMNVKRGATLCRAGTKMEGWKVGKSKYKKDQVVVSVKERQRQAGTSLCFDAVLVSGP